MRRLLVGGLVIWLSGCGVTHREYVYTREQAALIGARITSENITNEKRGLVSYQFNFLDRYRISHKFWWGDDDGLCHYGLKVLERGEWAWISGSKFMIIPPVLEKTGDMIKRGDRVYQQAFGKNGWYEKDMSPYIQPYKQYKSLCRALKNGYSASVSLIEGSTNSIEQSMMDRKKYAISRRNRVEAPEKVRRMSNEWTMIRIWSDGNSDEYWYLPIGKSGYYYSITATSKSNLRDFTPALNRLLDSFQILEIESPTIETN